MRNSPSSDSSMCVRASASVVVSEDVSEGVSPVSEDAEDTQSEQTEGSITPSIEAASKGSAPVIFAAGRLVLVSGYQNILDPILGEGDRDSS